MSAMENLVKTILKAMDVDVETLKTEVIGRVIAFEKNVETLNSTLISLHQRQERLENQVLAICAHLNIPTAKQERLTDGRTSANGNANSGAGVSVPARGNQSTPSVADAC